MGLLAELTDANEKLTICLFLVGEVVYLSSALGSRWPASQNYEAVKSHGKDWLLEISAEKTQVIGRTGSSYIPEVSWSHMENNGNTIPKFPISLFNEPRCLIIRDLIEADAYTQWREQTKQYIRRNPGIKGIPHYGVPSNWYIHWSKAQLEPRSHPRMIQLMEAVEALYRKNDPDALLNMDSHVVYADRLRITCLKEMLPYLCIRIQAPSKDGKAISTGAFIVRYAKTGGRTGIPTSSIEHRKEHRAYIRE
ncbi:hypothetical protein KL927_004013 [Ogataea polymorpha]|nr:hypothetical protein KL927_004013 [Ogataea polymorpha]